MFAIGTKVIWLSSSTTYKSIIKCGTVTRANKNEIWVDNQHKAEDCLYSAFAFPDIPETRALLEETIALSKKHHEESEKMYIRQLEMNNEMVRRGLK